MDGLEQLVTCESGKMQKSKAETDQAHPDLEILPQKPRNQEAVP
jgi:hypothetical protein